MAYLAPATVDGVAYLAPADPPADPPAEEPAGPVDIAKISPARIVVFGGSGSRVTPF